MTIARECAEKLFDEMNKLDNANFVWVHNPHAFLPGNVCCDHHGHTRFMVLLTECVQSVLDKHPTAHAEVKHE
jgi:hypothetical protein